MLLLYALLQSLLLVSAQVALKFALAKFLPFAWTREFWLSALTNWQFALCGVLFGASGVLWMMIVKRFPFSQAYPMVSISYVLALVAAIIFFHEEVSAVKWVGSGLIVLGCFLIAK